MACQDPKVSKGGPFSKQPDEKLTAQGIDFPCRSLDLGTGSLGCNHRGWGNCDKELVHLSNTLQQDRTPPSVCMIAAAAAQISGCSCFFIYLKYFPVPTVLGTVVWFRVVVIITNELATAEAATKIL